MIKFVLDTRDRGLKIAPIKVELPWLILLYTDSDWAGDKDNRRSTGGYMIFVNGVLVSWRSKLQKVVSLSRVDEKCFWRMA